MSDSLRERVGEARESVSAKLLRCRRMYLAEIASSPGKRAAFEILTELPIDWEKAAALEEQVDEPFRPPNFRKADMVLTAENGWLGDLAFGRNRMAEARAAMNEELIANGGEPIDWGESIEEFIAGRGPDGPESTENSEQSRERHASYSRDACPDRPTTAKGESIDVTNSVRDGAAQRTPPSSSPTPIGDPARHPRS